jgi:hypothetical protein
MTPALRCAFLLATLSLVQSVAAQGLRHEALPYHETKLYAATGDGIGHGALAEVSGPTGGTLEELASTEGGRLLRRFGQKLFVVDREAGTILRVPLHGGTATVHELGASSEPMDVHVPGLPLSPPRVAWVTRRLEPFLYRLDLASGLGSDAIDLSPVGGGAAIELGTMERDGSRLFVQVRVAADAGAAPGLDTGVLAVVDLATGTLLDVDPVAPGVQGVALQGAPPRFKMQLMPATRRLFVSTTDSTNDARGGIEIVDVDALASVGYAITEEAGHSDMGGFVMVDEDAGYYVFHTDLLPSTHLQAFSISGGADPGQSLVVLLNDTVDTLACDAVRKLLYLPGGHSAGPAALYAFSTVTNLQVGPPLSTGLPPHDVLAEQVAVPGPGASPLK